MGMGGPNNPGGYGGGGYGGGQQQGGGYSGGAVAAGVGAGLLGGWALNNAFGALYFQAMSLRTCMGRLPSERVRPYSVTTFAKHGMRMTRTADADGNDYGGGGYGGGGGGGDGGGDFGADVGM